MKIGVISDIHGNHYALQEVIKSAIKKGVEKFLVLGDIVGYYYHPDKVLDMLNDFSCEIIKGNHEDILYKLKNGKISFEEIKLKYGSGHQEALKKLSPDRLKWLLNLPIKKSVTIDNLSFQLNHGSPWNSDEYIYPDSEIGKLEKCDSNLHDFVLIGHSHYSFSYRCANSTLINCGSVGQSRQQGGIASWVLLNTNNSCYQIIGTPYDTAELLNEVKAIDPSFEYSYKILKR